MNRAKRIADLIRTVGGKEVPHKFTSAIILAAGSGERMGSDTPKQFLELCGMPVVVHTLRAYQECPLVDEIVLVCRSKDEFATYEEFKERFGITKLAKTVIGDKTRQLSVIKGLEAVSTRAKYVAIADAARCLTTPEMIRRVLRTAYQYDAAVAATRATDTVKLVEKGFVTETVPREQVWLAQTPQAFSLPLYTAAAYHALEKGITATDDSALVEELGRAVFAVDCGRTNIKITTPEDIAVAEALLAVRHSEAQTKG